MPLLEVRDLSVAIAGNIVLAPLEIDLEPGRILGVSGESGAGKSMAAYAITGLLPEGAHCQGQVTLDGQRLDTLDDHAMGAVRGHSIGMVFQEPMTALNPLHSIGEQVAEVFRQHQQITRADARTAATEVLNRVGLGDIPDSRLPHELSGGQRQRVVIAMAIALRPKLLIADEATTALDAMTQKDILALIAHLVREDNIALMLITHDLGVIASLADDLIIMQHGQVVEKGPVTMLASGMQHPHALALRDAASLAPCAIAPRPHPPLMELRSVSFRHPGRSQHAQAAPTLERISFTIGEGETVGLVGASGSGKSTLSRLLLGLQHQDQGEILLNGKPLSVPPRGGEVSAVFQDPYASFNPRHQISRLVAEPFHALGQPTSSAEQHHAVAKILQGVGIDPEMMNRLIHAASGGQRQRIAFARALITHPKLIVLDEPVSALDAPIRAVVLQAMAGLAAEKGIATVFISHDLAVVRSVCPRVMVLADGRVVEDGPTEKVFSSPQHETTQRLTAAALDWQQALQQRFQGTGA